MATWTPWGMSDYSKKYAPGINYYSTPGHGGFRVSDGKLEQMPPELQAISFPRPGWFEHDAAWCAVALAFRQYFTAEQIRSAKDTLRTWYPVEYEKYFKVKIVGEEDVPVGMMAA